MTIRVSVLALGLAAAGCGTGRALLEKPIADRCAEAGLTGCQDLTEGVLLYVDGNAQEGKPRLRRAIRANAPEDLKSFAETLKALSRVPGADSYMGPLREVIAIMAEEGTAGEKRKPHPVADTKEANEDEGDVPRSKTSASASRKPEKAPSTGEGKASPAKTPADAAPNERAVVSVDLLRRLVNRNDDVSNWRGGTVVPAESESSKRCLPFAPIPNAGKATGYCVRVAQGPMIVTQLLSPGGCSGDLYVTAGPPTSPKWIAFTPSGAPLNLIGTTLALQANESLTVGIAAVQESKIGHDVRCSITWVGRVVSPQTSEDDQGI